MSSAGARGRAITLRGVFKSWDGVAAVQGVALDVPPGTFTVLLGPSGCGKSTTLRIVAGLEFADQGEVSIGGREVSELPPAQRDLAMVFQSYALFPHLSVAENILFGLKVRRVGRAEQREKLAKTAELLGLGDYLHRKPSQLSGGQQQRVALGRAIIAEKPVCLMDEPLSNLDAKLRNSMRSEIRSLQQSLGFSMIYVTHDQSEAITMADQVVLMRAGQVEQAGTPRQIYQQPATTFAASFIGTPPMNLLPATELLAHLHKHEHEATALDSAGNDNITIGVRPEHLRLAQPGENGVRTEVSGAEYLGADTLAKCRLAETSLLARVAGNSVVAAGDTVTLTWHGADMHFFDADGRRLDGDGPHRRLAEYFDG